MCSFRCLREQVATRYCEQMNERPIKQEDKSRRTPVMSVRTKSGSLIEMTLDPRTGEASLLAYRGGEVTEGRSMSIDGRDYVPYSAENNLLTHRVVLLPSAASEYESDEKLVEEVKTFIHRYVDLSPGFEEVAAHYVLLTWGYDVWNEVPYLRVRGDCGKGKSRFLLTVGSLCQKPIFASGASTVSPIFRLIDQIGGTLVVDEADFWASDERAEIVKILNNGNARGFPVLRSETTPSKEFSPRAFNIYGPKIVATRHRFEDTALESRCLTEVLGDRPLRPDVPISLPEAFKLEAEELRNKLLMYRFRRFGIGTASTLKAEPGLDPRRAQILAPLLAVAVDPEARRRMKNFALGRLETIGDRRLEIDRLVLGAVKAVMAQMTGAIPLGVIVDELAKGATVAAGADARLVGTVLRRLGVEPQKSNGNYKVGPLQRDRLLALIREHGLGDLGDVGDENLPGPTMTEAQAA